MADRNVTDLPSPSIGRANITDRQAAHVIGENAGQPVYSAEFTSALAGMGAMEDATGKLLEAESASRNAGRDQAASDRLRRGAQKSLAGATKALEDSLSALGEHRTKANAEVAQAVGVDAARVSVTDNARGAEVREFIRSLDRMKRMSAIQDAIREGDREFIAGILAMPRLAGLTADEAAQLRADAESTFAPEAFKRRAEIDVLAKRLRTAGGAFIDRFGALAGVGDTAGARAERALAALEGGAA
ncbi:MAG: hypothetical protein IT436_17305 [Phycisphaerales bacterium]|nr:hypothetical protein [Phycisphaerales bacterium]